MIDRPKVGTIGYTHTPLSPIGEALFAKFLFEVRPETESFIDRNRYVVVTGFDTRSLLVREATLDEITALKSPPAPPPAQDDRVRAAFKVFLVLLLVIVGLISIGTAFVAFSVGGLFGLGYVCSLVGHFWLLGLIIRECDRNAIFLALLIPFFTWYFAFQRMDVARRPFLLQLLGLVLCFLGPCVRF